MASFFNPETPELPMEYSHGDKVLPYRIIKECKGIRTWLELNTNNY